MGLFGDQAAVADSWAEVDLREEAFDDALDLRFGVPGDCPGCGRHARLVNVDIGARVSRHDCRHCDREWWVADSHPGIEFHTHP